MRGVCLALALLGACASKRESRPSAPSAERDTESFGFFGMGTVWRVSYVARGGVDTNALNERVKERVLNDDLTFSDWLEESELRMLERDGLYNWQNASERFVQGLRLSEEAFRVTRGSFDPTIGAVQWKVLKRPVGLAQIQWDGNQFRFRKDPKRLTFGGLAKGLAVGSIAEILEKAGIRHYRIDGGGGNVSLRSEASDTMWPEARIYHLDPGVLWHISRSRAERPLLSSEGRGLRGQVAKQQHIFDPRDPTRKLEGAFVLACRQRESRTPDDEGALTDALSKSLVIEQGFRIPEAAHCRRL